MQNWQVAIDTLADGTANTLGTSIMPGRSFQVQRPEFFTAGDIPGASCQCQP